MSAIINAGTTLWVLRRFARDHLKNVDGRDKPGHDEKFAGVEE
ncbi:MAG: hypothetical protein WBB98_05865 [Xanthobacteraceae bacterium]